ncbi:MAG: radical SAM protein [Sporomusaceae bacterium]|jgi:uncharacterized radical SAM superfamily Fe-S cluster-containing enzyme|nr:radical SAM protein [Sporomusaceae bacterium]
MKAAGTRIFINATVAYCPTCQEAEQAKIIAGPEGVFLERVCPVKGAAGVKLAADYNWYLERVNVPRPLKSPKEGRKMEKGCPLDCGICECHAGSFCLPIFSITNDCNLDCPICFTYNRPDQKYYKSVADTQKIIAHIVNQTGGVPLLNLTGGEPTLHPELFSILAACQHEKIGRVTMNTNGLRLAAEREFAVKIKEAGVQLVLSLDTFDPHKSVIIHGQDISGAKRKALQVIEELAIPVTLLAVCIKGVNEADVAQIVSEYIKKPFVRSITIQNMAFTGRNGSKFTPREHITIDEVEKLLSGKPDFDSSHFFALGSYHPLCYSAAYYLVHAGRMLPLSKLIAREKLSQFTQGNYLLNPGADFSQHFLDGINKLWAEGEDEAFISALREFITELYPAGKPLTAARRLEVAEKMLKMVYIHAHMDDDNFDLGRVSLCGDLVPDETGRMIPACSYNLFYRQQDARFWLETAKEV